jgi:hypothetical protein
MKAIIRHRKGDIHCEPVPDPKLEHGRDAIITVTACAIRDGCIKAMTPFGA